MLLICLELFLLLLLKTLTNATIKQGLSIANKGWVKACKDDDSLKLGLNIVNGHVVYKAISDAFDLDYKNINEII